jgi:hypothetical protein
MDEIEFLQKCSTTPGRGSGRVVRLVDFFRFLLYIHAYIYIYIYIYIYKCGPSHIGRMA